MGGAKILSILYIIKSFSFMACMGHSCSTSILDFLTLTFLYRFVCMCMVYKCIANRYSAGGPDYYVLHPKLYQLQWHCHL